MTEHLDFFTLMLQNHIQHQNTKRNKRIRVSLAYQINDSLVTTLNLQIPLRQRIISDNIYGQIVSDFLTDILESLLCAFTKRLTC